MPSSSEPAKPACRSGATSPSRARGPETRLYVTGTPREHESHFHDLDDRDPLARFGRALEESAVEELAVDQRPLPSGPRHDARPEIERSELSRRSERRRLLEQKQRALSKTRGAAERKLEAAERRLAQKGASVNAVATRFAQKSNCSVARSISQTRGWPNQPRCLKNRKSVLGDSN